MPKTPYENLPLLPNLIAETVCGQPYEMQEWSPEHRSQSIIDKVEAQRKAMSPEAIKEFAHLCDKRCLYAYEHKMKWFLDCVKAKDNRGRDQLYVYIRHWMTAFVDNPERFRQRHAHFFG